MNPNMTIYDINQYTKIPWNYDGLSLNKNMTMTFILNNLSKKWNYDMLAINEAISLNDIYNNIDVFDKVNIESNLCSNRNISLDWIQDNKKKLDFWRLSSNTFK